ncbi:MAG: asparagine synthase-related protein, partial [Verrucomicrobiia bacterium]
LHPLEDLRLIEYCLSIPMEYFAYGSQKRGLFRESMRGIFPESVRIRQNKGAFIPRFHHCIRMENEIVHNLLEK